MNRMDRDQYYLHIAQMVSLRSTCKRANVGCVLVNHDNGRIVSMGYNGSVKGGPHCIDVGCLMLKDHCIRTIHAEANAVANLERNYEDLFIYTTHQPCFNCLKLLIAVGVKQVYYMNPYISIERDLLLKDLQYSQKFMEHLCLD